MAIVLDGTSGIDTPAIDAAAGNADLTTLSVAGNEISAVNSLGFRNRIINGDMRIDQRNNGASVTITNTGALTYTLDRWAGFGSVASKFSVQQVSDAPLGFVTSLKATSLAATTVASGDQYTLNQSVEGFNTSDLGWGTASAQTVTLSFWVKSSLTGTLGGSLQNQGANRSYPFTYAISAANTWEQKTITIVGDTSGTWSTDNTAGIRVYFGLGLGSTFSGTAGAWAAANFRSATGAVSVVGTSGATLFITGVQLEAGSVATPFERRDYGRELIMCQRYYQKLEGLIVSGYAGGGVSVYAYYTLPVEMRASPTLTITQGGASNAGNAGSNQSTGKTFGVFAAITSTGNGYRIFTVEMTGVEL